MTDKEREKLLTLLDEARLNPDGPERDALNRRLRNPEQAREIAILLTDEFLIKENIKSREENQGVITEAELVEFIEDPADVFVHATDHAVVDGDISGQ